MQVRRAVPAATAAEPATVTEVVPDGAPAAVAATESSNAPAASDTPQRWVEKRGNRTITTTVVPVRKASAAKPAEKDND